MKTKQFLLATALILGVSMTFTSCSKDDDNDNTETPVPTPTPTDYPTETVSGNITTNTTWSKDKIYILDGRVMVTNGAELTINAGTVVKGKSGEQANASALIVAPGAKIHATGTASEPIIFTSESDQIEPGSITSPNLTAASTGLWGGVIILGNAPISASGNGTTADIEGVPAGTATYGGSDTNDDSGEFQYCSIRHCGIALTPDNEINGLTLGGVGAQTDIDHVEIYATVDDGIEFFGGSVSVTDAVVAYQGDDGYDVDMSFSGTISNFANVMNGNNNGGAFEIDGPEVGGTNDQGMFTFDKGLIIGASPATTLDYFIRLKSGAQGELKNTYFTGFDASTARVGVEGSQAYANFTGAPATLKVTNCMFNVTDLGAIFNTDQTDTGDAAKTLFTTGSGNSTGSVPTNGFDASAFNGWTVSYSLLTGN